MPVCHLIFRVASRRLSLPSMRNTRNARDLTSRSYQTRKQLRTGYDPIESPDFVSGVPQVEDLCKVIKTVGKAGCLESGAPRHAVLNPWRSQEELGGMFLGHQLTRNRKEVGTRACWKSGSGRKTLKVSSRKTRVIWRKLNCLNPNSQRRKRTLVATASNSNAIWSWPSAHCGLLPPTVGR